MPSPPCPGPSDPLRPNAYIPLREPAALQKGDRIWVRKQVDPARFVKVSRPLRPPLVEVLVPAVVRGSGPRVAVVLYPDPDRCPLQNAGARGESIPWDPQPGLYEAPFYARSKPACLADWDARETVPDVLLIPEHNVRALSRHVCLTTTDRLQHAGGVALAREEPTSLLLPHGPLPRFLRAHRRRVHVPGDLAPRMLQRALSKLQHALDPEWLDGDAARVYLPRDHFLAVVWALADHVGYRSRGRASFPDVPFWLLGTLLKAGTCALHEVATADLARLCSLPDAPHHPTLMEAVAQRHRYLDPAREALAWIRETDPHGDEFLEGLRYALGPADLTAERAAWAASLYAAYGRRARS